MLKQKPNRLYQSAPARLEAAPSEGYRFRTRPNTPTGFTFFCPGFHNVLCLLWMLLTPGDLSSSALSRLWCRIPVRRAKLLSGSPFCLSWTRWTKESFGSHHITGQNTPCVSSMALAPRMVAWARSGVPDAFSSSQAAFRSHSFILQSFYRQTG